MNDDDNNKVNPLLQAYADKVLAEYKQELIKFLNKQFQDCIDEDIIGAEYNDPWIGGKEYAFELVMEFITDGQ